jgi:anti-sigma regulatory factor (Ser/Thr protein kinase)
MTGNPTDPTDNRLDLRSRLSDIAQISVWIKRLALRHNIPEDLQFAMNLCLEEALSNIIVYGYRRAADHALTVHFTVPRDGYFVFVVEDEAPRFNPLEATELPPLNPDDEMSIGGQGIRLLRRFAHTLEYQATPNGNRLRIGFSTTGSAVPPK